MAVRTRNQVIAFRVTLAEARKIREKVRRSGLSQQEYLLRAALEQPILVIHELKPILTELRAWGRNLNQLTVLAHTGHILRLLARLEQQADSDVIDATTQHSHGDRKALAKEQAKKIAMGHKADDHEEGQKMN